LPDRVSRRCGISSQLASSTVRAEVTWGAVTAATNKDSQQVFRNQRFVVRVQRSYRSYRFDGREIFAPYPTAACSKMIKGADVFRFHVTVHQEAIPSLATS
jgi:adenylyl- and sulfurtransferase ThiI